MSPRADDSRSESGAPVLTGALRAALRCPLSGEELMNGVDDSGRLALISQTVGPKPENATPEDPGPARQSRSIVETLASLSAPVTLVHGREDAVIPWQHALNAPPATALHLLPGTGHMPHWEAVALTTNIIIRAAAEVEGLRSAG